MLGRAAGIKREQQMGMSAEALRASLDALAARNADIARALAASGHPEPRTSERGYATLLRTIIGQQVSVASARAIWTKLEAAIGDVSDPELMAAAPDELLRGAGLSRQKMSYARSLAEEIVTGLLDLDDLAADDEAAIAKLVCIKGIGRWSAEIYLLFAEGRLDIWPAGDLAVQVAMGRILGLPDKPSERQLRDLSEPWRPHRGALAIFTWHHYKLSGAPIA
jgi:DNA-3-methyladenine glycosylase II